MKLTFVSDSDESRHYSQLCTQGHALRVYRGAFLHLDEHGVQPPAHVVMAASAIAIARSNPTSTVSGKAAAVLHGYPLMRSDLQGRVLLTRPWDAPKNPWHDSRRAPLTSADVQQREGVRVTSPARTVADLAGTLSRARLLAIADAAKAQDADMHPERKGQYSRDVSWVRQHMSGRSESIAESISRAVLLEQGIAWPMLQGEVRDDAGQFIARVDFADPEVGLVGEFDGKVKYEELVGVGETAADVVMREKRRENELRALGWEIVRWGWQDLQYPDLLVKRILAARDRGRRQPAPKGSIREAALVRRPRVNWSEVFQLDAA